MRFLSEHQCPSEMEDNLFVEGEVKEGSLGDLGNLQDWVTPDIVGHMWFSSVLKLVFSGILLLFYCDVAQLSFISAIPKCVGVSLFTNVLVFISILGQIRSRGFLKLLQDGGVQYISGMLSKAVLPKENSYLQKVPRLSRTGILECPAVTCLSRRFLPGSGPRPGTEQGLTSTSISLALTSPPVFCARHLFRVPSLPCPSLKLPARSLSVLPHHFLSDGRTLAVT